MKPSIGRSQAPPGVRTSLISCPTKPRFGFLSGPQIPSLRSEVNSKGTDRHAVLARVASLEIDQATGRRIEISGIDDEQKDTFDWERQWYPLAFVSYLDPKVPHAKELLGVRLVLWRDAGGKWRCFEDKCPHRLAPLSEGRIEPSDGTLMCSYHGWRFDGEAKCTDIPQSLDAKANAAACNNPRSCATARPTKVLQGMIFVWGKSGPSASAEAAAKPPLGIPDLEMTEGVPSVTIQGVPTATFIPLYYRELPYGWDVLAENLLDPSHLPFAHHGVLNRRDDEKAGHYRMDVRHTVDSPTGQDVISVAGESVRPRIGDLQGRAFQFNPPSLIRWYTYLRDKGDASNHETLISLVTFYVIPVAPGKSAVLFQGFGTATATKSTPLLAQLFFKFRPGWSAHCFTHMVFDGDSKILYMQERLLAEASRTEKSSWQKKYYMPAQADRLVAAFRKWLDERGSGGPPTRLPHQLPSLEERQEAFLDRYSQHTRHCPTCQGAVRNFERLRIAGVAAGVICLLALSSALGRGLAPLSPIPVGLAAGALVSLAVWSIVGQFQKKFYFVGYNHSET